MSFEKLARVSIDVDPDRLSHTHLVELCFLEICNDIGVASVCPGCTKLPTCTVLIGWSTAGASRGMARKFTSLARCPAEMDPSCAPGPCRMGGYPGTRI